VDDRPGASSKLDSSETGLVGTPCAVRTSLNLTGGPTRYRSLWLFQGQVSGLVFIGRVSSPLGTQLFSEDLSSEGTLLARRGPGEQARLRPPASFHHVDAYWLVTLPESGASVPLSRRRNLARRVRPHRIYRLPAAFGLYSEAGRKFTRGEIQRTSGISRSCREDPEARSGIQVQEGSAEPIRRYRRF
jgi:hypothetical protein